jgi:hypothetical protein
MVFISMFHVLIFKSTSKTFPREMNRRTLKSGKGLRNLKNARNLRDHVKAGFTENTWRQMVQSLDFAGAEVGKKRRLKCIHAHPPHQ